MNPLRELEYQDLPMREAAHAILEEVEAIGGHVRDHTLNRTSFGRCRPTPGSLARAGYVGLYRAYGSERTTVRVRVWAPLPRRLVSLAFTLGAVTLLLYLLFSAPPTTWVATAAAILGLLMAALLLWVLTRPVNQQVEESLADRIGTRMKALPRQPPQPQRSADEPTAAPS